MNRIQQILYRKAMRYNLEHAATYLVAGSRMLAHPLAFGQRIRQARRIAAGSARRGFMTRDKGFALFEPGVLPGADRVVEICQKIFAEKCGADGANSLSSKKPYLQNILEEKDLLAHPEILEFVLSDPIIEIAAGYLGYVPELCSLALFVSRVNSTISGSQMFHWDSADPHHLKCFIHISDVGPEHGPFTLLSADKSRWLRGRANRRWSDAKLADADVFEHCNETDVVSVTGLAGSGVFVDTSQCLHCGSRVASGVRVVFNFHYATFSDYLTISKDISRDIRLEHYPALRAQAGANVSIHADSS